MQMPPTSPDTALEPPVLTTEHVTPPAGRAVALRWRQWLGLGIVLLGIVAAAAQAWQWMASQPTVEAAWWSGLVAALATALGTLPVLLSQRLSERAQDTLFGFGAGVMLAACAFSLIIPGLHAARGAGAGAWGAGATVGGAILLGALVLLWMERLLPHEHFIKGVEGAPASRTLQRTWLFVFAIALHNLPEGLAIGVAHAGGDGCRVARLDLQVLGRVGVDQGEAGLDVVDEDDRRLATGQRGGHPLGVLGRGHPACERLLDRLHEVRGIGDEHRRCQRVVLGLGDQVRGDVIGIRAVVGEHGDLGGAGLGVDADDPLQQALGGGDVDVARTGDEADGVADLTVVLDAVREGSHGLGTTHGPHLVHTQEGARGEDRRVRPATVVALRRARDGQARHLRELGGHDVHDDAARVHGQTAGHVEADPVDGHPALGDRAPVGDLRGGVGPALVGVNDARPADGLLERGAHGRVQRGQGVGDDLGGHPQPLRADAVEALRGVVERRGTPLGDVGDDRTHGIQRRLDVELGTRQGGLELTQAEVLPAQVETGNDRVGHAPKFRSSPQSS